MSTFKDNFSKQSDLYLKYRPLYPKELYAFIAGLASARQLCWDCGTGNGQAATGIADFFDLVLATDPSENQINNCIPHPKVIYKTEKAEKSSLPDASVDLIIIANALHWFDFDSFYSEAKRVLKPRGIIAAWSYTLPGISEEIDPIIKKFHDITLGEYWLPENRLVEKKYATIPFPFNTIECPEFYCEKKMNIQDVRGYFNTWSATQRYIEKNKTNPVDELIQMLSPLWKNPAEEKTLKWTVTVKAGKNIVNSLNT